MGDQLRRSSLSSLPAGVGKRHGVSGDGATSFSSLRGLYFICSATEKLIITPPSLARVTAEGPLESPKNCVGGSELEEGLETAVQVAGTAAVASPGDAIVATDGPNVCCWELEAVNCCCSCCCCCCCCCGFCSDPFA